MIEEMLAGAAIFATGAVSGRYFPARRRGPKPPKPVQPICGCGHHHGMHDPETGHCHDLVKGGATAVKDAKGNPVKDANGYVQKTYEKIQCGCPPLLRSRATARIFRPGDHTVKGEQ